MRPRHESELILCADDEVPGLILRRTLLESQGYRALTAQNGPDALRIFAAAEIDLVVLDYFMPGMDGGVVADGMKAMDDTPILMLSAYMDLPEKVLAQVDRFLTKGESPKSLLATVRELIETRKSASVNQERNNQGSSGDSHDG